MASKRSPACGVRESGAVGQCVGGGCDVYDSGVSVVRLRSGVVASGRRYGLVRRPPSVSELTGRPGVGDGRTDGCCGRGGVVGGVGKVVCVQCDVVERVGVGCVSCAVPAPTALTAVPNPVTPLRMHGCLGSQVVLLCRMARRGTRCCCYRPLAWAQEPRRSL